MSPLDLRGRHAVDAPRNNSGFVCPACGAANTGRLEDGCASCGSGKPGTFIGIDPIVRKAEQEAEARIAEALSPSQVEMAWDAWVDAENPYPITAEMKAAFRAGFYAGQGAQPLPALDMPPAPVAETTDLTGTAESRTIKAALALFIEQVLRGNPEESQSGEWLTAAEADALLKRWEVA